MKTMDMNWLFEGISKEELELDKLLSDISIAIIKERYALDMNQKDFASHCNNCWRDRFYSHIVCCPVKTHVALNQFGG